MSYGSIGIEVENYKNKLSQINILYYYTSLKINENLQNEALSYLMNLRQSGKNLRIERSSRKKILSLVITKITKLKFIGIYIEICGLLLSEFFIGAHMVRAQRVA